MAEDGQVTPEKQLLKLIEDPQAAAASGAASRKGLGRTVAWLTPAGLKGLWSARLSFFKRQTKKRASAASRIDIGALNRVLTVAVVCLLAYVTFDAIASAMSLHRPPNFAFQKETGAPAAVGGGVSPLKESAYYMQKVNARDIFKEGPKIVEAPKPSQAAPAEEAAAVKSLSVVGISWSSDPDVILEDKDKQKTYFVKRGQMVGDGVKVEAVFKDHVVLSYEGQEYELR